LDDLAWLEAEQVRELEPSVFCVRGLASPSTGLIDSHGLMLALGQRCAQRWCRYRSGQSGGRGRSLADDGIDLDIGGSDPGRFRFRTVVNAAGFSAPAVARTLRGLDGKFVPKPYFARGHYFTVSGPSPFKRLIYPLPGSDGLGIHVALDLAGNLRFGPDVTWIDAVDYAFDESRAEAFYRSIRPYYPGLADGALAPGFVGVRPKLGPAGSGFIDFLLQGRDVHGVPGLLNLFGIDSPGLTSSLAIADEVARRLE
jgi:L-2-hydroxyglutarate oxidase LhgO